MLFNTSFVIRVSNVGLGGTSSSSDRNGLSLPLIHERLEIKQGKYNVGIRSATDKTFRNEVIYSKVKFLHQFGRLDET